MYVKVLWRGEVQIKQVLGPGGYQQCLLQRFVDQMDDTGWIVKSTYFWLLDMGLVVGPSPNPLG